MRPALIRNDSVYPSGEWLRGHWVTQVRDRRPHGPQTAPLLSVYGTEKEGVTKARALGAIRKDLMSCFGPGLHCGLPLWEAIQGPDADHNQKSFQSNGFAHRYESGPVLSDVQNAGVNICGCFGAGSEKKKMDRQRKKVRWSSGEFFSGKSCTLQES